jgi:hypothetical protein
MNYFVCVFVKKMKLIIYASLLLLISTLNSYGDVYAGWVVVCESIYGTGIVLHTDNGGTMWESQGLPAGQVLAKLWIVSLSRTRIPEPASMILGSLPSVLWDIKRN